MASTTQYRFMPSVFRTPVRKTRTNNNNEQHDGPLGTLDGNLPLNTRSANLADVKAQMDNRPRKEEKEKRKKPKPSSLCQTPPSVILGNGNSYQRGSCIGEGGFARCFQVANGNGEIYAAKTLAKAALTNDKTRSKLITEIKIHRAMKHPNIVKYVDCFEDEKNVYVLLEMCSNQSLADMVHRRRSITETEARFYFVQILGAVSYMHQHGVVHRDLKLGNIFLDEKMNLKVGDFGLAARIEHKSSRRYTICGTPNYISPEILLKPHSHGLETDMWAIGIILYAMLVGRPPFQDRNVDQIYESIKNHTTCFPDPPLPTLAGAHANVSNEARDLIANLLNPDPELRPTIEDCLNHKWLHKGSFVSSIPVEARYNSSLYYATPEESVANLQRVMINSGLDKLKQTFDYAAVEDVSTDELKASSSKHILPPSISPPSTKDKYKPVAVPDTSAAEKKKIPDYDSPVVGQTNVNRKTDAVIESPVAPRVGILHKLDGLTNTKYTSHASKATASATAVNNTNTTHSFPWNKAPLATRTSTESDSKPASSHITSTTAAAAAAKDYSRLQNPATTGSINIVGPLTESVKLTISNLRSAILDGLEPSSEPAVTYTKPVEQPLVVTRWADFEENWGVAYCLNDGSVSILFRDKTSMRMDPIYMTYVYFESRSKPGLVTYHKVSSTPTPRLSKKVEVLTYVKKYMDGELGHAIDPVRKGGDVSNGVIVNTLHKERDYIMFVLSDGTLQFNFKDHYKLILYDCGTKVGLVTDQHQFFAWNMHGALKAAKQPHFQRVHLQSKLKVIYSAIKEFYLRLR